MPLTFVSLPGFSSLSSIFLAHLFSGCYNSDLYCLFYGFHICCYLFSSEILIYLIHSILASCPFAFSAPVQIEMTPYWGCQRFLLDVADNLLKGYMLHWVFDSSPLFWGILSCSHVVFNQQTDLQRNRYLTRHVDSISLTQDPFRWQCVQLRAVLQVPKLLALLGFSQTKVGRWFAFP